MRVNSGQLLVSLELRMLLFSLNAHGRIVEAGWGEESNAHRFSGRIRDKLIVVLQIAVNK